MFFSRNKSKQQPIACSCVSDQLSADLTKDEKIAEASRLTGWYIEYRTASGEIEYLPAHREPDIR